MKRAQDREKRRINVGHARRRTAIQVLLVCCVALLARMIYMRRLPERVGEGMPADVMIAAGNLYWIDSTQSANDVILSMPVTGGNRHEVVRTDARHTIVDIPAAPTVSDRILFYSTKRILNMESYSGGVGVPISSGAGVPMTYLGTYRKGRQRGLLERKATKRHIPLGKADKSSSNPPRLNRVALPTGKSEPVLIGNYSRFAVGSAAIYWVKPGPDEQDELFLHKQIWNETDGKSEIHMKSLANGSERLLRAGIPEFTPMAAGLTGVFWIEDREFPDQRKDLCYYRTLSGRLHIISDFDGELQSNVSLVTPPAELHERLYWIAHSQMVQDQSGSGTLQAIGIVSANLDGRERTTLVDLTKTGQQSLTALMTYRGKLYVVLAAADPSSKEYVPILYRLPVDQASGLEMVRKLPVGAAKFKIDDHYLYFFVREIQRGFLAQITDDQAGEKQAEVLYRVDLNQ